MCVYLKALGSGPTSATSCGTSCECSARRAREASARHRSSSAGADEHSWSAAMHSSTHTSSNTWETHANTHQPRSTHRRKKESKGRLQDRDMYQVTSCSVTDGYKSPRTASDTRLGRRWYHIKYDTHLMRRTASDPHISIYERVLATAPHYSLKIH